MTGSRAVESACEMVHINPLPPHPYIYTATQICRHCTRSIAGGQRWSANPCPSCSVAQRRRDLPVHAAGGTESTLHSHSASAFWTQSLPPPRGLPPCRVACWVCLSPAGLMKGGHHCLRLSSWTSNTTSNREMSKVKKPTVLGKRTPIIISRQTPRRPLGASPVP